MKIQIRIQEMGKYGYTVVFLILCVVFFLFIRLLFLRKPYKPDDSADPDEEEEEDDDVKGKKKKDSYTSEDFLADDGEKRILVLYATQTGTAREFSETIEEDASKFGFKAFAASIHNYQRYWSILKEGKIEVVCFVLATYGEGEPTDSAKPFHNFLSHCSEDLASIKFVSFGLGNSQYTCRNYQAFSKSTIVLMKKLGAELLCEAGEGDSDQYIEEDFDDWRIQTLDALSEKFGTERDENIFNVDLEALEPKYELKWTYPRRSVDEEEGEGEPPEEEKVPAPFAIPRVAPTQKAPFGATLVSRKELLKNEIENSTMELIIDTSGSRIKYVPGDHLGVWPPNDPSVVLQYAQRLNCMGDLGRGLSLIKKSNPIMGNRYYQKTSLFNVLTYYCDLTNSPSRKQLRMLVRYTEDAKEKELLKSLVDDTKEKTQESRLKFREMILEKFLNWFQVLEMFSSCKLPLDVFLEVCAIQKPRYYSIASTQRIDKDKMKLVVSVYRFVSPSGRNGTGVTSRFLETVPLFGGSSEGEYKSKKEEEQKSGTPSRFRRKKEFNNKKVYCFVRESIFRLPPENELRLEVPVILISNGTGLAPFLGFLEELECLKLEGNVMLYFGCRNREKDFIYGDKLQHWKDTGIIREMGLAFSRDQEGKEYVQHVLLKNKEEVVKAIQRGGYVYICGSSAMAKEVNGKLIEIVKESVPRLRNMEDDDVLERLRVEAWNI